MQLQFSFTITIPAGEDVPAHTHQALEIVYFLEGRGSTALGGARYDIQRGVFAVIPAGVSHDQRNASHVSSVCLSVAHSGLERYAGCWRDFDDDGELGRLCQRVVREMDRRLHGYEMVCQGLLLEIAGLIARAAQPRTALPAPDAVVEHALARIHESNGQLRVEALAEGLYISASHLRQLFRQRALPSPSTLLTQVRITRAKALLAHANLPIKLVAQMIGIENAFYFSRLFKRETGQTPSAFRATVAKDQ